MFNKAKSNFKNKAAKHLPSQDSVILGTVNTLQKIYGNRADEIINVLINSIVKNKGDSNSQFISLSALLCYAIELNKNYNNNKESLERIINIIIEHDADDAKFSTGYIFLVHHDDRLGNKVNAYYDSKFQQSTELCIPFMVGTIYRYFSYVAKNNEQFIEWKKVIIANKTSFDFLAYLMENTTLKDLVSLNDFYADMPVDYQLGVLL